MSVAAQPTTPIIEPFNAIAEDYDHVFTNSFIGRAQRNLIWREMDRVFLFGHHILEINCGTGTDAFHLADRGIHVVACDSSRGMISVAQRRRQSYQRKDLVEFRHLATEHLARLEGSALFDGVLSNFGGLNCLSDLSSVARDLAPLVRRGGKLVLCVFGRFCLWETLRYLFRGDFRNAFRRWRSEGDLVSLSATTQVRVQYSSVSQIKEDFSPFFTLNRWGGVGMAIPPSYLEPLVRHFPDLFRFAARFDALFGFLPGIRATADHVLLIMERS